MSKNSKMKELEKAAVKANSLLGSLSHMTDNFGADTAISLVNTRVISEAFKQVVSILESIQGAPKKANGNATLAPKKEPVRAEEAKPAEEEEKEPAPIKKEVKTSAPNKKLPDPKPKTAP